KLLEQEGTQVRAIPAPGGGSRKFADRMNAFAQKEGLPGMGYIFWRAIDPNGRGEGDGEGFGFGDASKNDPSALAALMKDGISYDKKSDKWVEAAGPIAKALGPERTEALRVELGLGLGDAVFFVAGKPGQFEPV